jgi:HK97 family phage portal protein
VRTETFDWSLGDPAIAAIAADWWDVGGGSTGLPSVGESDAFGLTPFSRGCELIAGTIASLPFKSYEKVGDERVEVPSWADQPQGPYAYSKYQWTEMVVLHLVIYREAFLRHVYNGFGSLVGFLPVHPSVVKKVEWVGPQKRFILTAPGGGEEVLDDTQMTQIMGPNVYGNRGVPLYKSHKKVFQVAIAGEIAAGRSFTGSMISGLVTTGPDVNIDPLTEGAQIKADLDSRLMGTDNAGRIAFVNADLKFTPWYQTNVDAQFQESRAFQVEEFARMLGLMPLHLAQTEKQTSWGTGIAEQNIGVSRYTLAHYTSRIESALSPLLPDGVYVEFDYKGFLQGSPAEEIRLVIEQVAAGIMSPEYAATLLHLPAPPEPKPAPAPVEVPTNG